jgi:hypothetical protein
LKPRNLGASVQIKDTTWWRNTSENYRQFKLGLGGNCSVFTPPASYWCTDTPEGGVDNPPTYMVCHIAAEICSQLSLLLANSLMSIIVGMK